MSYHDNLVDLITVDLLAGETVTIEFLVLSYEHPAEIS